MKGNESDAGLLGSKFGIASFFPELQKLMCIQLNRRCIRARLLFTPRVWTKLDTLRPNSLMPEHQSLLIRVK